MTNKFRNYSIKNILSNEKGILMDFPKKIDINSLCDEEKNKNKDDIDIDFDLKTCISKDFEIKKKLQQIYNNIYINVLISITTASKHGFKNIDYTIPVYINCIEYNSVDCIKYVIRRVKEKNIDVKWYKNTTSINLSWDNLIKKLKDTRENKKTQN